MWEKEKLLVTSNFFFSHSVFERLVVQTRKNQGLFGKGLTLQAPFTTIFAFGYNVDQDQTAQNVQPDLDLHCLLLLNT